MVMFDPALFGHGALLVLLAASLVRRIDHLRAGLALAALLGLLAAIGGKAGLTSALLIGAILLINAALLAQLWLRETGVRFSAEEQALRQLHFGGLGPAAARRLIDQGHWISARRGELLIREDQAVPSLFYLADGEAAVQRDGARIGMISAGALIGEATVIDGGQATGTVQLASNARLWFVPAAALRAYLAANPDIAATLHEGFARALRGKLAGANARIAEQSPSS
ncbi:MAG: cyclic nucleotide-binding protein [Sphingopyxis macrogoltabida]|uniref:Cyclic nucleotide-binding protein n=1 Tax=Sphingopyxis macrogoltabida TaxID=33050 RepID=A0A2W5L6N6_SPHMC|nr:MAG: cyclic nucleotide-binding protein [Sphingopyxis macrogoltabida]